MRNVTQAKTNMFSWTLLLTTDNLTLQLDPQTKRLSDLMDVHTLNIIPLVGKCAANERMVPHPGRAFLTSRNLTQLRLQNMQ